MAFVFAASSIGGISNSDMISVAGRQCALRAAAQTKYALDM